MTTTERAKRGMAVCPCGTAEEACAWPDCPPAATARRTRRGHLRNRINLDASGTKCVLLDGAGTVQHRLLAYEMTTARNATTMQLRVIAQQGTWPHTSPLPEKERTIARVRGLLVGECCYVFHCHTLGLVKIGRTTNLIRRWSDLESKGGRPLQLVAVWLTADSQTLERALHKRFADGRTLGEWFGDEPVLAMIRDGLARGVPITADTRPSAS